MCTTGSQPAATAAPENVAGTRRVGLLHCPGPEQGRSPRSPHSAPQPHSPCTAALTEASSVMSPLGHLEFRRVHGELLHQGGNLDRVPDEDPARRDRRGAARPGCQASQINRSAPVTRTFMSLPLERARIEHWRIEHWRIEHCRCAWTCCLPLMFAALTGRSGHGLVQSRPCRGSIRSASQHHQLHKMRALGRRRPPFDVGVALPDHTVGQIVG